MTVPAQSAPLPALRGDLALFPGAPGAGGTPAWLIHDRPRNRFFRLGWLESEMLVRWTATPDSAGMAERINRETTLRADVDQVEGFVRFLVRNGLTRPASAAETRRLADQAASRPGWGRTVLHHYLFFRIPLWRPDRFLVALLPWVTWMFRPAFAALLAVLAATGLFLVSRQWEAFLGTFPYFFSLEGAAVLGLAILFAKGCHELGHALTARRFGCRVPVMGVAFLVLWPLLYTDTSDSWRLTDRRQRFLVAAGGMAAEVILAVLATLAWSFVEAGIVKSALFSLATVTWITALVINANPFMRFDGYFLLSDWLDIPNLQERAFALGRWRLRRLLLGIDDPPPEAWPRGLGRFLVLFAWTTWAYRFVLFLGIALLVYHFFFKALGIVLMLVEIAWFILGPLLREAGVWYERRAAVSRGAATALFLALLVAVAALFFPWQSRIAAPAVLRSEAFTWIHPPDPARIETVHVRAGDRVARGDPLFTLVAPDLEHQLRLNRLDLDRLAREGARPGERREAREDRLLAARRLEAARERRRGLLARRDRLRLTAPMSGVIGDLPVGIAAGLWVGRETRLAHLFQPGRIGGRAWLEERDRHRVTVGSAARFYPEEPLQPPIPLRVTALDPQALPVLEWTYAASLFDGAIPVRRDRDGRLIPTQALYRVTLAPRAPLPFDPGRVLRGTVHLQGERESLARRIRQAVAAVWIRETGF